MPPATPQTLRISGLANVEVLQKFQDTFLKLTDLYTTVVDLNGDFVTRNRGQREFCRLLAAQEKKTGISNCYQSNCSACRNVIKKKKPIIYRCYAGLTEIIVPILVNDNPIGAVITGQIRVKGKSPSAPTYRLPGAAAASLAKAFKDVPEVAPDRLNAAADLLFLLINYIFKIEFELLTLSEVNKQCTYTQEIVKKATDYIDAHYVERDLSLNKVADMVHLSPYYFSHIFKKELHTTFVEYLTKIRLAVAVTMLKEHTQKTIKQIAYTVGYEDPYYFSKVFHKYYKVSPERFRARYQ